MKDFRSFLEEYEEAYPELVIHIRQEVSARWQASAIALKMQKELREAPLLIFDRVRMIDGNISPFPVVLNAFASRKRCAFAVNSRYDRLGVELFERRSAREKPVVVDRADAPVKQVVKKGAAANLRELPGLVHAAWDPGAYISAGYVTTYDPDSGVDNSALHRGWMFDDHEIRLSVGGYCHNGKNIGKVESRGEDARVAIWVGHHLGVCIGSESKLGYPESHWEMAGGVVGEPLRLVASETLGDDFLVPADAEFVIEGIMRRGERKPEGPFGEYPRYFGGQGLKPLINVTCITHRQQPYWFSIVTGYGDDGIGALRREGNTFDLIKRAVPEVTNIFRPPTCPFYMYVQMRKRADWQPRAVITAALSSPDDIKYVFVFDEDVDIFDEHEVHWAVGTRSDWAKDIIVIPNLQGSPLHPAVGDDSLATRGGIDCTKPSGLYEQRSFIPADVMDAVRVENYLPTASRALAM